MPVELSVAAEEGLKEAAKTGWTSGHRLGMPVIEELERAGLVYDGAVTAGGYARLKERASAE